MKPLVKWFSIASILVILVSAAVLPMRVRAAAPTITNISPTDIVNNINNAITIDGTDFADQAEVYVGSDKIIVTSFSPVQLIARVPAGFEPGVYSLTVTNPGAPAESFTVPGAIHVSAPGPTPTPQVTGRPQIVIDSYTVSVNIVQYSQEFTLSVSLDNAGGSTAYGMQITFSSADLLTLRNGGVIAKGNLGIEGKAKFSQALTLSHPFEEAGRASLDMTVTYTDAAGTSYSDKFNVSFPTAKTPNIVTLTPSPRPLQSAQMVITDYQTDVQPLQPGTQFKLSLTVQNTGNSTAKNITMIVGGGSASGNGGSGTPQPGGINGGSGEFSNFAPVNSSNIQNLGSLVPGAAIEADQELIVNVSANPGAYTFKISFAYADDYGNINTDDQVITLLIYSLPNVEVSFYQPVSDFFVGQQGPLPLQLTSLGKRTVVVGKMTVTAMGGTITNGEALVGNLDPGGYFTLDAMVMPDIPGTMDLNINIEYTDDFNQTQMITKTISINVIDMPVMPTPEGGTPEGGIIPPATNETTWHKIWRFVLGMFGLDSSAPSGTPENPAIPTENPVIPPIKGGGGKG